MIQVTPVEPKNIEVSLNNLWEENKGENRFRACLFNLIIYSSSSSRCEYLSTLAEHILNKFPSRVLLIKESSVHTEKVKSSIANIKESEGGSSIFCDYIEFEVGKDAHKAIPFLVLPHLVADHPIYLLWDDDPLIKDPVSFALENTADRTIFDSNITHNLKAFSQTLLDLKKHVSCSIADLNWARTAPFRTLLTNIFSDQIHFNIIDNLQQMRLFYKNNEENQGCFYRALYLQAFLASMMGFKYVNTLKSGTETHINYTHKARDVSVILSEDSQKQAHTGVVLQIELQSNDNVHLNIKRMKENKEILEVQTTFSTHCQMPSHHIINPDLSDRTLCSEVYSKGTDPYFQKTLEMISKSQGL